MIAPNLVWNAHHGFATLNHTADNASWGKSIFHPGEALEFLIGQLGVFGPLLFAALVAYCVQWLRDPRMAGARRGARASAAGVQRARAAADDDSGRAVARQCQLGGVRLCRRDGADHSVLLRQGRRRFFALSLGIHLCVALLIGVGGTLAGRVTLPGGFDPYARLLGWKALAEASAEKAREGHFAAIAINKRALAAELLYYLRDAAIPVVAMRGNGPPGDHFEMTRPLDATTPRPVLLVSFDREGPPASELIGAADIAAGHGKPRHIFFHALREAPR